MPLETRHSNAYVLAFDNTAETATGEAVNSQASLASRESAGGDSRRCGKFARYRCLELGAQRVRRVHAGERSLSDDGEHSRDHRVRYATLGTDRRSGGPLPGRAYFHDPAISCKIGFCIYGSDLSRELLAQNQCELIRTPFAHFIVWNR